MTRLAIKGHSTRGKEVIELLEMLGGVDWHDFAGNRLDSAYYISDSKAILFDDTYDIVFEDGIKEFITFTLEEFLEKFPYKVGDKVHNIIHNENQTITNLSWDFNENEIVYLVDNNEWVYVNYLQPYKEETMEEIYIYKIGFNGDKARLILPDGYESKVEGNEVFVIKKKPKYPKTYEECCEIIHSDPKFYVDTHLYSGTLEIIYKLLICRDAYWKIAGEELGLGKPWEPDFTNNDEERYGIYTLANKVERDFCGVGDVNMVLSFPTEEMRDIFYKNFMDLIEGCKKLL
jgi:hypothetical protein